MSNQVGTLGWFIDTVLLDELNRVVVVHGFHYLGFGLIGNGIEFLGACMDGQPFDQQGLSRKRFNAAMKDLFSAKYTNCVDGAPHHDLYTNLRCGMAHIMRPQADVVFTGLEESKREGTAHLQLAPGTTKLVLVAESFYCDFANAATQLKSELAAGKHPKAIGDGYLAITSPGS